ncbi:sensor histidine kinase [Taibaiella koreensis]|uniref:sensor histidine kinase n=1 Tax=Taibaiella koreensis TaxID=1268548 RepID=UPI000E59F2E9|nr:histidine kinase [Taibaiella koreensis]
MTGLARKWALCCLLLHGLLPGPVIGQERIAHYHEQNGLLSDLAYNGLFDRNNYLWICTGRGLSRFNGVSFIHYTVRDGLPANDIIYLKEDEAGVIWAAAFQREAAFLEPGKTLFINVNTIIDPDTVRQDGSYQVFPIKDSTVALVAARTIRLVRNRRWIKSYPLPRGAFGPLSTLFQNNAGDLVLFSLRKILLLHRSGAIDSLPQPFSYLRYEWEGPLLWLGGKTSFLTCIDTRIGVAGVAMRNIRLPAAVSRFGFWGDSLLLGKDDRTLMTVHRSSGLVNVLGKRSFLSTATESADHRVRVAFTHDEGIYVSVSTDTGRYHQLPAAPAYLLQNGTEVQVLDARNRRLYPEHLKGLLLPDYERQVNQKFAEIIGPQTWIYGGDVRTTGKEGMTRKLGSVGQVKDVYRYNDSIRYLATGAGAFVLNGNSGALTKLSNERCTSISEGPGATVYIGNYRGLQQWLPDGRVVNRNTADLSDIRIMDLAYHDSILWIATGGKGLWALYGNRMQKIAGENNGLTGNVIETLAIDGRQQLVLGYANGVQRMTCKVMHGRIRMTELLTLHTAQQEGIKYLHYAGGKIYGMGSRGLLILPDGTIEPVRNFRLQPDRILIDGVPTELKDSYELTPGIHDFSVAFSTVNYEQFPLRYRYRINDGAWTYASEPFFDFHNLGPGDYLLSVQVLNNYARPSDTRLLHIQVAYPFYQKASFIIILSVSVLVAALLLTRLWYRFRYNKARDTLEQEGRLRELELAALKAQINPHFVFNCLNSIKGLIYEHRLEEADQYMDRFASLFRMTLEGSVHSFHSLSREIQYIDMYLSLEQVNVNNRFSFSIAVAPLLQSDQVLLPPMLLQPCIENAVKHGVARVREQKGRIQVLFREENDRLVCTIIDNGNGRVPVAAGQMQEGRGLSITRRRARLYQACITIGDNDPSGTIVELSIPLRHQEINQTL